MPFVFRLLPGLLSCYGHMDIIALLTGSGAVGRKEGKGRVDRRNGGTGLVGVLQLSGCHAVSVADRGWAGYRTASPLYLHHAAYESDDTQLRRRTDRMRIRMGPETRSDF